MIVNVFPKFIVNWSTVYDEPFMILFECLIAIAPDAEVGITYR